MATNEHQSSAMVSIMHLSLPEAAEQVSNEKEHHHHLHQSSESGVDLGVFFWPTLGFAPKLHQTHELQ